MGSPTKGTPQQQQYGSGVANTGGALNAAMRGQVMAQNNSPSANPIMDPNQLNQFMNGGQVSTGGTAQPMNYPFGGAPQGGAGVNSGGPAPGLIPPAGGPTPGAVGPGGWRIPGNPDGLNYQRMRAAMIANGRAAAPMDTSMAAYNARTAQEQKDQVANDAAAALRPVDQAYLAAGGDAAAHAAASAAVQGQPIDPNSYFATHTAGGSPIPADAWAQVYQRMATTPQGG